MWSHTAGKGGRQIYSFFSLPTKSKKKYKKKDKEKRKAVQNWFFFVVVFLLSNISWRCKHE